MKHILIFEEFTEETLSKNNYEYDSYFKNNKSRSQKVAWGAAMSQLKNFNIISKCLSNNESILDYGCGLGDFIKHLDSKITVSDYLGVDINSNFISQAKIDYPNNKFKLIKSVDDINGKYDSVCAIGVFTWFITKEDFVKIINKLHEICNKQVLITCLYEYGSNYNSKHEEYWNSNYRYYDEEMFKELFPNLKMSFKIDSTDTMLVKINK